MSWERRGGKGRYYTRSQRRAGRVVRQYVGTGPEAEQIAARDAAHRAQRLASAAAQRAAAERYQATIEPLIAFCRLADQLLAAALTAHGYHRHDRGSWRRKRMAQPTPQEENKAYLPDLQTLLECSKQGDTSCLPELRRALDEYPDVFARFGDLVKHIQLSLVNRATSDLLSQEAISREFERMRSDLRATATTSLEKLLADRVALTWFDLHVFELDLAHRLELEPVDSPTVRATERFVHGAHARHLAATKALAVAQKFLRPAPSVLEVIGGKPAAARSRNGADRQALNNPVANGAPSAN